MPPFGHRKVGAPQGNGPEPAPEPTPAEQLADAEAALNTLLTEQAQVHQTLAEHQQQRHEWLADGGDLKRITDLDRDGYRLKLRAEQIDLQLPPRQTAVQQARAAVHEANWQGFRPRLVQAQECLATAIGALYDALGHVQDTHNAAHRAGFADRLGAFPGPPPKDPINDYSLREYLKAAERKPSQPVPLPEPDFTVSVDAPLRPFQPRFVPRRVPHHLVEQISPIAPMRRVRLLHTIRASNLNIGHARLRAHEEMEFPARVALVLTYSGVGVYTDVETAETTAAA